jgi:hypothetical protein
MDRNIFGGNSNLPPGVRVSDIPGNRPEDEAWENIYDNFWDKERLTTTHIGTLITEAQYEKMGNLYEQNNPNFADEIDAYISAAIEYGMEIGQKQAEAVNQENRFYETRHIIETLEKAGISQEVIGKVEKILGGDYETP